MKNIHIIPTDKPTYLYEMEGKFHLSDKFEKGNEFWHNQNIYITSDEEIKVGYHVFNTKSNHYGGVVNKNNLSDARLLSYIKKIILTTDQDLIKDGVQAIDDEFLEWFVKNPSCEYVEVKSEILYEHKDTYRPYQSDCKNLTKTKINYYLSIIPQEEPKQETLEQIDQNNPITKGSTALVYKQETLEEASKRAVKSGLFKDETLFIAGVKWQQEQNKNKYSEEDFKEIVYNMVGELAYANNMTFNGAILDELFNKFKKK